MSEIITGALERLGLRKKAGNLIVGRGNVVEAPGGQVTNTVIVGENNEVTSKADPNTPVVIEGNKFFGKNKITIE